MSSILPAIRRISQTRKFSTARLSVSAPWLMLPPSISGGGGGGGVDMAYNFFSLSSGKVSLPVIGGKEEAEFFKDEKTRFVGSSHGWLALSNHTDLFLTNPQTGHHIKLPPPPVCEKPPSKVIVSCPPEYDRQGESVAMMIYGPTNKLATCHPGRSHEWTTIGDDDDDDGERSYDDFVYSTTLKRFLCISKNHRGGEDLECCEVGNSKYSPPISMDWKDEFEITSNIPSEDRPGVELEKTTKYLVFAEESDQLYLVVRRYGTRNNPNTQGFHVYRIDRGGKLHFLKNSLDNLIMFVGNNHSFALRANEYLELKANSIYFTNHTSLPKSTHQDTGIFHYPNNTFSPYHCLNYLDLQTFQNSHYTPLWFTPNLY